MDFGSPLLLTNILTEEELTNTPTVVQEKFKQYIDGFVDDYCKEKAAGSRAEDYQQRIEELESKVQDYEVKLQSYQESVDELRTQLNDVSSERNKLLETVNSYEEELKTIRTEKNAVKDEYNYLLQAIERLTNEQERQQQEIRSYQEQLKNAINEKCKAIARMDEIESKSLSLDMRERRMEQERNMLNNQIQTLSDDLNRSNTELQMIRREHTVQTMRMETNLIERTEELKIIQSQCEQYKTTNAELSEKMQELANKLLKQNEDSSRMMEYYKKELDAKTRMIDLYKSNCNDTVVERSELTGAIAELKRMLNDASEEYGHLETKFKSTVLTHDDILEKKDKEIEDLRAEIKHANELLKELQQESVETAISKLAPSAAVASRLIRADMSLTELYSLYVRSTEELEVQKRENSRLSVQIRGIMQELQENVPTFKKMELDYEKMMETNTILLHQRDDLTAEKAEIEDNYAEAQSRIKQLNRESLKLKRNNSDLSRQVCFLLEEVKRLRSGCSSSDQQPDNVQPSNVSGSFNNTDDVISKKLVTFADITELQENNQKLLMLVRELSSKLEEVTDKRDNMQATANDEQYEKHLKKVQQMQETLDQQQNTITSLLAKVDRYKKMYFNLRGKKLKDYDSSDFDDEDADDMMMIDTNNKLNGTGENNDSQSLKEDGKHVGEGKRNAKKRIHELEQQINDCKEQYKTLKEQHEYYFQEKKNNDKIMNEQFDSMRSEVRELTSDNCKLITAVEHNKEQVKILQRNLATYKQQIQGLESRNKSYENTIIKHEQTTHFLKNEIMKEQCNNSAAQTELNHLRHENRLLKDTSARLQSEKDANQREQQQQNLLLNNLEIIKANLERSETEGRLRLEHQLDETVRELSAQRRRFQEDQDRFRELTQDLQRQTESAKQRAEEERLQSEKLRNELQALREELSNKSTHIDTLNKKLQDSLIPSKRDNPITLANKRARECEIKYEELKIEYDSIVTQLAKAREHADQYYRMSQSAENEIKKLHEMHTEFVAKSENELKELRLNEQNLKSRIIELESEIQLTSIAENTGTNQPDELKKIQAEHRETLQKLSECNRELCNLRIEKRELDELLNIAENKYAHEMLLHSTDIQALTAMKNEQSKFQTQMDQLQMERDTANRKFEEFKDKYEEINQLLQNERDELEKRLEGLNETNRNLHDQIEALTSKLEILSQNQNSAGGSLNASRSDSLNVSDLNLSQTDEDGRGSERWLQIIKFLRKEKDLTVAKLDIIKAENTRLATEHAILQKKVEELKGIINQEQSKSETVISSSLKHEEVLRKIETLDALTDSNRILREERNTLADRIKEQNERLSQLEAQLFPIQDKNRELHSKVDELSTENTSLRTEAIKWRQRANLLVEKSNKNPEEFKRLQLERDNLLKLLAAEKEQIRQLSEELATLRAEKTRQELEHATMLRQLNILSEEKRKLTEDLANGKQQTARLMQEIMELKNKLLQKEESMQKLSDELEQKEAQLQDSKSKEIQIRKIAKRYKDSYMELSAANSNNTESNAAGGAAAAVSAQNVDLTAGANETSAGAGVAAAGNAEAEQQRTTIDSLNSTLQSMQEENDKLRKEIDEIKKYAELEDRTKVLLREATQRIFTLKESNEAMHQELTNTKSKLKSHTEHHDANINSIKTQYEDNVARLEKELTELNVTNKEALTRLTRENESLLMRINQLNRQLGLQQSAKPSTSSSGAGIDKSGITESSPRTANVKPMSGSSSVQQSATVTPWRGSETPLASIRPISVQNSRTAAILPTSQQATTGGGSSTTSSSSSSTSSAATTGNATSASSNVPTSAASSNTALVPPQQQVHTTGSSSLESMSASPTSSHADYIPSTSSASVTVATIPPMGTNSAASVAESSQEAESMQQNSQNESQQLICGGSVGQQQVVALVSPRVEGALSTPNMHNQLDASNIQQPSTSGTSSTSSSLHVPLSSHSRHTPSSSSVTTSQSTSASSAAHKRPRELEGDSSTNNDDHAKRTRCSVHSADVQTVVTITDSGTDVEYQVPTSSQRDQEDDITVVVDSEDEDEDEAMGEADDEPVEDGDAEDNEGYEDSYEQDQGGDDNDGAEQIAESHDDVLEVDNNEVDIDDNAEENQAQVNEATAESHQQQHDNHQQSQTISSGSQDSVVQGGSSPWKQTAASGSRQNVIEIGSSPGQGDNSIANEEAHQHVGAEESVGENIVGGTEDYPQDNSTANDNKANEVEREASKEQENDEVDEEFPEEVSIMIEETDVGDNDNGQAQDVQQSEAEGTNEDNECADGVSSEGEKQAVEMEEEGREAEATTSPTMNTRSKTGSKPPFSSRRPSRGNHRGGSGRPTPIVWKETPTHSRTISPNQRTPEQSAGASLRGFPNQRSQRARRMRRPAGNNYGNMRFP